jgi:hypothetical protein
MAGFKSAVHAVGAKWVYMQYNIIMVNFTIIEPKDNLLNVTGRDF